jgi:hypothetical protein
MHAFLINDDYFFLTLNNFLREMFLFLKLVFMFALLLW